MVLKAKKSILVVDDEPDIVTIIEAFLRKSGKSVRGFTDPVLALEHFQQHSDEYDTVISDIRMPGMNGFELVRKLGDINPELRIFIMTAFEMYKSEFEKVFPSIKIADVIEKPVSMYRLLKIIEA
ncbi:MAG: DNA-binding NtrC family response regulator [Candidatus Nitrosomirales archaeon]|jgi:DNA-binding NtrC family response regulator